MSMERPHKKVSVLDQIKSGKLVSGSSTPLVSPLIYDPETGKPIEVGNRDPDVIGPDDYADFSYRPADSDPEVPPQVKNAEIKFIAPMAQFIASTLGITVLDDHSYNKILQSLRDRSLFVVLNIKHTRVEEGVADWMGLCVMVKHTIVAMVRFKMRLTTEQIGITEYRLWSASEQKYYRFKPDNGKLFFDREEVSARILNYFNREGVLAV